MTQTTAEDDLRGGSDDERSSDRQTGLAILLIVAGVIGWIAAFVLMIERIHLLQAPTDSLSCDFGSVVQCSANLDSAQGEAFGFPNPILGLTGWMAPIVTGAGILAGARFARWYWWLFTLGMAGAMSFVSWLISQSIFVIGTLCPWCMVTWAVTIPAFLATLFSVTRSGILPVPPAVRRVAGTLSNWLVIVVLACYLVIAVLAQLRLDFIGSI